MTWDDDLLQNILKRNGFESAFDISFDGDVGTQSLRDFKTSNVDLKQDSSYEAMTVNEVTQRYESILDSIETRNKTMDMECLFGESPCSNDMLTMRQNSAVRRGLDILDGYNNTVTYLHLQSVEENLSGMSLEDDDVRMVEISERLA